MIPTQASRHLLQVFPLLLLHLVYTHTHGAVISKSSRPSSVRPLCRLSHEQAFCEDLLTAHAILSAGRHSSPSYLASRLRSEGVGVCPWTTTISRKHSLSSCRAVLRAASSGIPEIQRRHSQPLHDGYDVLDIDGADLVADLQQSHRELKVLRERKDKRLGEFHVVWKGIRNDVRKLQVRQKRLADLAKILCVERPKRCDGFVRILDAASA